MAQIILERIRDAVHDGRYRVTDHTPEVLGEDCPCFVDMEAALLAGSIVRIQGAEPGLPCPRYTIKRAQRPICRQGLATFADSQPKM